jgi:hypothetical protein
LTGISLHMQLVLISQLHGSSLKENNWFFVTDQTPHSSQKNHFVFSCSQLEGPLVSTCSRSFRKGLSEFQSTQWGRFNNLSRQNGAGSIISVDAMGPVQYGQAIA